MGRESNQSVIFSSLGLAAALAVLNASLTFANVWPTLMVKWTGGLSVELAALLLALVVGSASRDISRPARRWLAVFWVVLIIGRYFDVTSRSLYGRDVNLYWDLRLMPDVGAMFAFVAKPALVLAVIAGLVLIPLILYAPVRWAIDRVAEATRDAIRRRALALLSASAVALSGAQALDARVPDMPKFERPVTAMFAKQAMQVVYEMTGAGVRTLPPPVPFASDFGGVRGADVLLIFVESYGAVSWDKPEIAAMLESARAGFTSDVAATGRAIVSAYVESTTFGGESWLAHISLLSGIEVRDQDTNVRLMAQDRDTLAKAFTRAGYRTVAIMPGLQRGWPEGAFYGFDRIYGAADLDYGERPPFGWWSITDQYALSLVDQKEMLPTSRPPLFVFFPTISSHAPFTPAPPYQPDWNRVLTNRPYDPAELDAAWAEQADWLNLTPSYVKALEYVYATFGGYLKLRADRDLVMIVIGDHQPPSLVSGEGATWAVPMHVITNRGSVLERFRGFGFREGLVPALPAVARMDTLVQVLLSAFGAT